jgi:SAM-dependent methyltransferase
MTDWTRAVFNRSYVRTEGLALSEKLTKQECAVAITALNLQTSDRILDLACGHGRHSVELAKQGFHCVTGLDFNADAIAQAQEDAALTTAQFVQGDMTKLEYKACFDVVLSFFNSMFYWDDATHLNILRGVHQALVPEGRLLLDSYNPFHVVYHKLLDQHPIISKFYWLRKKLGLWRSYLQHLLNLSNQPWSYHETKTVFNPRLGQIEGTKHIYFENSAQIYPLSVRLYSCTEIEKLLHQAGFKVEKVLSSNGETFGMSSPRFILVAIK